MIKKILAITFLLASFHFSSAQSRPAPSREKLFVRFNFLGLADGFDQNFSSGIEYRFNPGWSTGGDIGWIFFSKYLSESKVSNGFILRPFIRYYPKKTGNGFLEVELHYKYVVYKIEDWVGRDPVNGVPSYQEFAMFDYDKNVFDIHCKGGTRVDITNNRRLKAEFIFAMGVRWKWQGARGIVYARNRGILRDIYNPKFVGVVMPATIRLTYAIK